MERPPRSILRRERTILSVVVARTASSEQTRIDVKYILVQITVRACILHPQMNIFTKSTSILRSTIIRSVIDSPTLRPFSSTSRIMAGQTWKRESNNQALHAIYQICRVTCDSLAKSLQGSYASRRFRTPTKF